MKNLFGAGLPGAATGGMAALLLSGAAFAAPPPPPGTITAAELQATVTFLADDLLEGRQIGRRGHAIAMRYVASQFAAMGLEPAGTQGFYQPISFEERSFASERETLTLTRDDKTSVFVNGVDLSVGPGNVVGAETISAPLVFVGFGLASKELGIDDYAGLDVRGKIVVALAGAPNSLNSEVAAHLARVKTGEAAALGAVGMITVRTIAQATRGPWSKAASTARLPRRNFINPDGSTGGDAGSLKFSANVDDAAAAQLFAGSAMSFVAVQAAAETGAPHGFALTGTVKLDRSNAVTTITSANLLARLAGSDPALTDQLVLLSAHLDHLGMRTGEGDTIYNGALDNAAGVATLLAVARSFAAEKKRPKRSLLFLVTTGEEGGLMGSSYFARYPTVGIERIVSGVNIDMPILTCDFADVIAYGANRSTMGPLVAAAAKKQGLTMSPDPQPVEALFTRSDHYPLVRAGIPAVFLKTGWRDTQGGMTCRDAETLFRRTHYHEPSDDLSRPIDWNVAVKFARINAEISRTIANAHDAPRWYSGDYFGEVFAPAAPKAKRE